MTKTFITNCRYSKWKNDYKSYYNSGFSTRFKLCTFRSWVFLTRKVQSTRNE